MKEKFYKRESDNSKWRAFGKVFILFFIVLLSWQNAKAQDKTVAIEWSYTFTPGLSCKYPMLVNIYYVLSDGTLFEFSIFKHPSYSSFDGYANYTSSTYTNIYLPSGTTITALRIAAGYVNNAGLCPGLSTGLCYSGGVFEIARNMTDYCAWTETSPSPVLCGLSNLKVKVNVSPVSGTSIIQQGTVKATYCPGETITFEVPCNMKGKGWNFFWYYVEGTGSETFLKSTSSETLTVGAGFDYTPKPGVITFLRVTSQEDKISELSGSFRYGAHAPTASIDPKPPKCADGDDWYIDVNGANSSDAVITTFKANIFHSSNTSVIPDGFVSFTGSSGKLTKASVAGSSRVFVPGTSFRVTIQNDFSPTTYGVCETSISGTYTIPNTPKITASEIIGSHKDLTCYNILTGEFQLNVTNGDGNYTIKLNDVSYPIKVGSPTNQPGIEKLDGGVYTIKVNDTNCAADPFQITITEPDELTASMAVVKSLDCFDSNNGQLKVNISGGIAPHSINWSTGSTSITADGLIKGTYGVTVSDPGCTPLTQSLVLDAPPEIKITLSAILPTCPGGNDGQMSVANLENAPGLITYDWSTSETSAEIFNLTTGSYSVIVTSKDAGKTCTAQASKFLDDPKPWSVTIQPELQYHGSAIKCNGDENGKLNAIVKNENGQVVDGEFYEWSTGETGTTKKFIDQLKEGKYNVVVRYHGVCETEPATILLNDPDSIILKIYPQNTYFNNQIISCYGLTDGSLKTDATGGTGTYQFLWNTGLTTSSIHNIGAGTYTMTVTDDNNCVGVDSLKVVNPAPVEALITNVSDYSGFGVSCYGLNDGSITAAGTGGTGVYSFSWSNGKTTNINSHLVEGPYTVTVSDNNGCKSSIDQAITAPKSLEVAVTDSRDVSCFGGNDGVITLQAKEGINNTYEFSKDKEATWQTSPVFAGLVVGDYSLVVKDLNGCKQSTSATLIQPSAIAISFTSVQPSLCKIPVGTATASVTGGVGGYTYKWEDSQASSYGNDMTLLNAKGDIYKVTVHDSHLCEAINYVPITSFDGAKSTYSSTPAKCFDSADGTAEITITSGIGPFVVTWPNGQNTLQGTTLKQGSYNVSIKDNNKCVTIQTVDVTAPSALGVNIKNEIVPSCNSVCDGQLELEAIGGVGSYVYQWNNKSDASQTQLCAGDYSLVLKDGNGCTLNQIIKLKQPDPLDVIVLTAMTPTCKDGCDGSLEVMAKGGNGNYRYIWDAGGNTAIKSNLCPGSYNISVTDSKGCSLQKSVTLANTPALPINLGGGAVVCVGQSYILDAGNGWSSIKWQSNTGFTSTQQKIFIKDPGSYWLEALNNKGCVAQDTFLLETSTDLMKASFLIPQEAMVGDTVAIIDISWPLPESIEWNYPANMATVKDLGDVVFGQFSTAGTYAISLTAHLGECLGQVSKSITILPEGTSDPGGRLGYEEFVKDFTLYPNPNDGSFEVGIELAEESPISLSVWNSAKGILITQVSAKGESSYKLNFDLRPLGAGAYAVRLDHAKGKMYLRFIVY